MIKSLRWIFRGILLAFVLFFPILFGDYYANVFVIFAIFALYSVSYNLLLGYTGLLSFGHAMFFGMGGYGTALALTHIPSLPLIPSVLMGLLAAVAFAALLSPLLVRVSGTAFAMLTLSFGMLMYVMALKLRAITGGEDGVGGFPIPPFVIPRVLSIEMTSPSHFYYFAVAVLGLSIWFLWFFTRTPLGCVMVGVRDNALRVNYLGYRVPETKAAIFLLSGGFAGVAGSIYALFQNLVSPDGALSIFHSFAPLLITMIGGVGSFLGPVIGSAIFQIIEEATARYTERVELVTGLILIFVILFTPMGLTGLYQMARQKMLARFSGQSKLPDAEGRA
jgi:branched-chain amino acid transport system permease protein